MSPEPPGSQHVCYGLIRLSVGVMQCPVSLVRVYNAEITVVNDRKLHHQRRRLKPEDPKVYMVFVGTMNTMYALGGDKRQMVVYIIILCLLVDTAST